MYGILYGLSCGTKVDRPLDGSSSFFCFSIFPISTFSSSADLLAGMATSILFSAFESWLINEHRRVGRSVRIGGGLTRISSARLRRGNAGHDLCQRVFRQLGRGDHLRHCGPIDRQYLWLRVGERDRDWNWIDGLGVFSAPFDSAILSFIAMCVLLVTTWSENHGDANAPVSQSFISAYNSIKSGAFDRLSCRSSRSSFSSDRKVFLLGIVQALFEASMYVFVLEWTPALTQALGQSVIDKKDNTKPPIPHGYVFASYMVAMMMGSNSFKVLCNYATPESFMR